MKLVGEETFRICQNFVDEMITVSTDDICAAIRDVFNDTRTIMEPAGALGVAGLTKYAMTKGASGVLCVCVCACCSLCCVVGVLGVCARSLRLGESVRARVFATCSRTRAPSRSPRVRWAVWCASSLSASWFSRRMQVHALT